MSSSLIDPKDEVHTEQTSHSIGKASEKRPAKRAKSIRIATNRKWTAYALPILVVHLLAILAFVPSFITWTNVTILVVSILFFGQGINLGYHRLLAHRSLVVPRWVEYFYTVLALCCMEETPCKWVSTHRRHHTHSDDDEKDPHFPGYSLLLGTHGMASEDSKRTTRDENG